MVLVAVGRSRSAAGSALPNSESPLSLSPTKNLRARAAPPGLARERRYSPAATRARTASAGTNRLSRNQSSRDRSVSRTRSRPISSPQAMRPLG